jgi:hypothetical protein
MGLPHLARQKLQQAYLLDRVADSLIDQARCIRGQVFLQGAFSLVYM